MLLGKSGCPVLILNIEDLRYKIKNGVKERGGFGYGLRMKNERVEKLIEWLKVNDMLLGSIWHKQHRETVYMEKPG